MSELAKSVTSAALAALKAGGDNLAIYEAVRAAIAAGRPDREGLALAELKRLHEKNGWQSTADVIARLEQEAKG